MRVKMNLTVKMSNKKALRYHLILKTRSLIMT